jgi:hypothetical protein
MSQPLDSAMPARPTKVPFGGRIGMFLCFYVQNVVPVHTALATQEKTVFNPGQSKKIPSYFSFLGTL